MFNYPLLFVLLVFCLSLILARYLKSVLFFFIHKLSHFLPEQIQKELLSFSKLPYSLLIIYFTCQIGFQFIEIEQKWIGFLYQPLKVIFVYSLFLFSWQFLDILEKFFILKLKSKKHQATGSITKHLIPYSKKIFKSLTIIIACLFLLQNSGFNIASLLASLGIGGVAVALAAKETLSNFFGGFSVIIDKPFSVGDWIVCNQVEGTVEDIGFRSTKVKTFYDSLLTIPNSTISDSVIDNLGKRESRRTRVTLDITYDSSPEQIEAFVEGIKNIIKSNPATRKDYYQCYFSAYGEHSLKILLNFFLKVSNWDEELLQKQNIFLEILRLAKELQIEFAFPTQTLYVPNMEKNDTNQMQLSAKELQQKAQAFGPQGSLSKPKGLGLYNPKN